MDYVFLGLSQHGILYYGARTSIVEHGANTRIVYYGAHTCGPHTDVICVGAHTRTRYYMVQQNDCVL